MANHHNQFDNAMEALKLNQKENNRVITEFFERDINRTDENILMEQKLKTLYDTIKNRKQLHCIYNINTVYLCSVIII